MHRVVCLVENLIKHKDGEEQFLFYTSHGGKECYTPFFTYWIHGLDTKQHNKRMSYTLCVCTGIVITVSLITAIVLSSIAQCAFEYIFGLLSKWLSGFID